MSEGYYGAYPLRPCKVRFVRLSTFKNCQKSFNLTSGVTLRRSLCSVKDFEPSNDVLTKVQHQINNQNTGRNFAVVHLCGKQFKVSTGDIVIVEGYWPPTVGDQVRLEKVMLAGCKDFTLFGRPILEPGTVDVQATVVDKTLSHTKTHFRKKRRKQYMRINFQRVYQTMLRINSIQMRGLDQGCNNIQKSLF